MGDVVKYVLNIVIFCVYLGDFRHGDSHTIRQCVSRCRIVWLSPADTLGLLAGRTYREPPHTLLIAKGGVGATPAAG
jgi:hypothetical protein